MLLSRSWNCIRFELPNSLFSSVWLISPAIGTSVQHSEGEITTRSQGVTSAQERERYQWNEAVESDWQN